MTQTAAFCRTQEALQLDRAALATLENVRMIASRAAAAWGREALLADRRETKRGQASALPAAASLSEEVEDRLFSENPDRGHAES